MNNVNRIPRRPYEKVTIDLRVSDAAAAVEKEEP